jgi:hypothetical protein
MRSGSWDVWVYNEGSTLVITSATLGSPQQPFLERRDDIWPEAVRKGTFVPIFVEEGGAHIVRIVLNKPLSIEEESTWVDHWKSVLRLPTDGLVLSGEHHYVFGDVYPEFQEHLSDVPAGDYLAEVFTYLPSANGLRCVQKATKEKLGAFFRRTRPGEPFPPWLARLCASKPGLDPGHEKEWKRQTVPADPTNHVAFLVRLTPLVGTPPRVRLKDGVAPAIPVHGRLPAPYPRGLVATRVLGRPPESINGPIKLCHRVPVAELTRDLPIVPVRGGPVRLPVSEYVQAFHLAALCYRGTYAELRLELPRGKRYAPAWPNASVGVRAEPIDVGWRITFEAMNFGHVSAMPHVAQQLAGAPAGSILELFTASPDTGESKGQPGWHRYRGTLQAGQWLIRHAYPTVTEPTLREALDLVGQMMTQTTIPLKSAREARALKDRAQCDSVLRDLLRDKQLVIDKNRARLTSAMEVHIEFLAMAIFRIRFKHIWPVHENDDTAEDDWNDLMDQLESIKEARTPPRDELLFEGQRGTFHETTGHGDHLEQADEWDRQLEALGFQTLGRMTYDRVGELTLLGYVLPNSNIYALVCLGGLFPSEVIDYYTRFSDGASQSTTTNFLAEGDKPKRKIFSKAFPELDPAELLERHRRRMKVLVKKHGPPRPAEPTLEALARAIDEYFVRRGV